MKTGDYSGTIKARIVDGMVFYEDGSVSVLYYPKHEIPKEEREQAMRKTYEEVVRRLKADREPR